MITINSIEETILFFIILVLSIIFHEVAHGYAAYMFGDPTAKDQGRLTLNPIVHADMLGSIIIPGLFLLAGTGILFGWAKPVPYNPYNLKTRFAETVVAGAGIITNIIFALIAAGVYNIILNFDFFGKEIILTICFVIIFVNLFLAVLNLIPIPPLDGSKIISSLLPRNIRTSIYNNVSRFVNINSFIFLIFVFILIFFFIPYMLFLVEFLTEVLIGNIH